MIEKLKQYPLVGLSLAIAGGLVLAHLITKTGDILYEYNPDLLATLVVWAVAIAFLSLVVWKRRSIRNWFGLHKKVTAYSAVALCGVICALFAIAASNERKAAQPVTLDFTNAVYLDNNGNPSSAGPSGPQDDAVAHAKLLKLQKQLRITPEQNNHQKVADPSR